MLTGVALVRRAAERMFEKPIITAPAAPVSLFDGATLNGWTQAGPGNFVVDNGTLRSQGGLGLLWYSLAQFRDFELSMDWKITQVGDNSGNLRPFPGSERRSLLAVPKATKCRLTISAPRTAL